MVTKTSRPSPRSPQDCHHDVLVTTAPPARGPYCHHLRPRRTPSLLSWSAAAPKSTPIPKTTPLKCPTIHFLDSPHTSDTPLFSPSGPPSLPLLTLSRFLYHCQLDNGLSVFGLLFFDGRGHNRLDLALKPIFSENAFRGQVIKVLEGLGISRLFARCEDRKHSHSGNRPGRFLRLGLTGVHSLRFQVEIIVAGDNDRFIRKFPSKRFRNEKEGSRCQMPRRSKIPAPPKDCRQSHTLLL